MKSLIKGYGREKRLGTAVLSGNIEEAESIQAVQLNKRTTI
jgi:hypothetical protein